MTRGGAGVAIGAAVGAALLVATGIVVWIPVGIAIGAALGWRSAEGKRQGGSGADTRIRTEDLL